jgi:hypothetical protein
MPDKLKEFVCETLAEMVQSMSQDDRVKGLSIEQRLAGVPVEERLTGLSAEEIDRALKALQAMARKHKANGTSPKSS